MLSHRAQEKINKYRAGYAATDVRRAFLPAVVSTSGRIHGDLLRLLYLLADNKTKRHFRDLDEAIDDDSQAYCWRRSGFFWRMRASLDEVPASKRFQEKKTKSSARTRKWPNLNRLSRLVPCGKGAYTLQ